MPDLHLQCSFTFRRLLQTLATLSLFAFWSSERPARAEQPDANTLTAAGIRTLESKHLTLYTDLPSHPAVDELPQVFDLAVPEWTKFFDANPDVFDGWHVKACLIQNKDRFHDYGLLPNNLPQFLHGFQRIDEIWLYEQTSDYYRRHLLLHEGTHAAMNRIFGRVGPVWYREGVAEMLGTHEYKAGKLSLGYFPADKKSVEDWGRIKIVNDDIKAGKTRSILSIVNAQSRDFLNVESYAWSWALQSFGHSHPEFAALFLSLQNVMHLSAQEVTAKFLEGYYDHRFEIDVAWELFKNHLDYGYDSRFESIDRSAKIRELRDQVAAAKVDSARGWQSSGLVVPANSTIHIAASGRFQVAEDSRPWISEPQGVTIEYYQGRPLGVLLAAIVEIGNPEETSSLTKPITIGRRAKLASKPGGILYFRVNERSDRLRDNQGEITVRVKLRQ